MRDKATISADRWSPNSSRRYLKQVYQRLFRNEVDGNVNGAATPLWPSRSYDPQKSNKPARGFYRAGGRGLKAPQGAWVPHVSVFETWGFSTSRSFGGLGSHAPHPRPPSPGPPQSHLHFHHFAI